MRNRWIWAVLSMACAGTADADLQPIWSASWLSSDESGDGSTTAIDTAGPAAALYAQSGFAFDEGTYHATLFWTRDAGATTQGLREEGGSQSGGALYRADGNIVSVIYRSDDGADCANFPVQNCPLSISAIDSATGATLWNVTAAQTDRPWQVDYVHRLTQDAAGTTYWLESDGGDYVVLRVGADGTALPEWRWSTGSATAVPTDIAAFDDGGVFVTGYVYDPARGYRDVRFSADGTVLFTDSQQGDEPFADGPSAVVGDAHGDFVLAGIPESDRGVGQLAVWKVGADGTRLWTREWIGNAAEAEELGGLTLDTDGDAVVSIDVVATPARLYLLRFSNADGALRSEGSWQDSAQRYIRTNGLVATRSGRVLMSFQRSEGNTVSNHLLEWRDGAPCRLDDDNPVFGRRSLAGSADGWTIARTDADADKYLLAIDRDDADGPCDIDELFSNGFD